jgi:monovalent cation:H+ antiporter-2, CPA2 family
MTDASLFLQDLALVLCVAAVTTVLFQWLKQSPILGYLLAGLILGPHVSIPLFAHEDTVQTLSELGVILVMYSIGLEFSLGRFLQVLPTAGLTNAIELSLMTWLGYVAGRLLGWTPLESLFTGAILSLASTMIATKALLDRPADAQLRQGIFGILVVQDLASVLLLALLTPLAEGAHLSPRALLVESGNLLGFLVLLMGLGWFLVPRVLRAVVALRNPETLLVAAVGLCFAMALLAKRGGYSPALGAFLAGMLSAESGAGATIIRLIHPLRDMFAAVFFVSVGMLVDPSVLKEHWGAVLALSLVVILGQTLTVSVGTFLTGRPLKSAIQTALALTQVGEFSYIIAQVGVSHGAIGGFLYDVTVAVSVVTAFTTPLLLKASQPFSRWVDSRLPKPLQTFTALYGSWLEELRSKKGEQTVWRRSRRLAGFLILDTFCLAALVIATAATLRHWLPGLEEKFRLNALVVRILVAGLGFLLCIPFILGIFRGAKTMGGLIASAAIPKSPQGQVDLGLAPRRVLTLALQLGIVFALGFPLLALTQPFLSFGFGPLLFGALLMVLGIIFWRSAVDLEGHMRAGAQMVAEALSRHAPQNQDVLMVEINAIAPGIGAPTSVVLPSDSPAAGKKLGELNLRLLTGASVIAITRGNDRLLMPSGKEPLLAGDTLVLVGTQEAIFLAKGLLRNPAENPERHQREENHE